MLQPFTFLHLKTELFSRACGINSQWHVPDGLAIRMGKHNLSSSSSWCAAFSWSLLPMQSSARTVYPPPAAGPRSLWHPCVSWQIWWIQVVGGRPQARLHSCDGRSPSVSLGTDSKDLIGWYGVWESTRPNRPSRRFRTMNETWVNYLIP